MPPRYKVTLTQREREELEALTKNGRTTAPRQCLHHRIPDLDQMRTEVQCWENDRNNRHSIIDWQFTTDDARIKLKHVYPKL